MNNAGTSLNTICHICAWLYWCGPVIVKDAALDAGQADPILSMQYLLVQVNGALRCCALIFVAHFHFVGVVAAHVIQVPVGHADDVFQVIIGQVAAADDEVQIFELLPAHGAVNILGFDIADRQQFRH